MHYLYSSIISWKFIIKFLNKFIDCICIKSLKLLIIQFNNVFLFKIIFIFSQFLIEIMKICLNFCY